MKNTLMKLYFFEKSAFDGPFVEVAVVISNDDFLSNNMFLFDGPNSESFCDDIFGKVR
jgi:hypothetical protein